MIKPFKVWIESGFGGFYIVIISLLLLEETPTYYFLIYTLMHER